MNHSTGSDASPEERGRDEASLVDARPPCTAAEKNIHVPLCTSLSSSLRSFGSYFYLMMEEEEEDKVREEEKEPSAAQEAGTATTVEEAANEGVEVMKKAPHRRTATPSQLPPLLPPLPLKSLSIEVAEAPVSKTSAASHASPTSSPLPSKPLINPAQHTEPVVDIPEIQRGANRSEAPNPPNTSVAAGKQMAANAIESTRPASPARYASASARTMAMAVGGGKVDNDRSILSAPIPPSPLPILGSENRATSSSSLHHHYQINGNSSGGKVAYPKLHKASRALLGVSASVGALEQQPTPPDPTDGAGPHKAAAVESEPAAQPACPTVPTPDPNPDGITSTATVSSLSSSASAHQRHTISSTEHPTPLSGSSLLSSTPRPPPPPDVPAWLVPLNEALMRKGKGGSPVSSSSNAKKGTDEEHQPLSKLAAHRAFSQSAQLDDDWLNPCSRPVGSAAAHADGSPFTSSMSDIETGSGASSGRSRIGEVAPYAPSRFSPNSGGDANRGGQRPRQHPPPHRTKSGTSTALSSPLPESRGSEETENSMSAPRLSEHSSVTSSAGSVDANADFVPISRKLKPLAPSSQRDESSECLSLCSSSVVDSEFSRRRDILNAPAPQSLGHRLGSSSSRGASMDTLVPVRLRHVDDGSLASHLVGREAELPKPTSAAATVVATKFKETPFRGGQQHHLQRQQQPGQPPHHDADGVSTAVKLPPFHWDQPLSSAPSFLSSSNGPSAMRLPLALFARDSPMVSGVVNASATGLSLSPPTPSVQPLKSTPGAAHGGEAARRGLPVLSLGGSAGQRGGEAVPILPHHHKHVDGHARESPSPLWTLPGVDNGLYRSNNNMDEQHGSRGGDVRPSSTGESYGGTANGLMNVSPAASGVSLAAETQFVGYPV